MRILLDLDLKSIQGAMGNSPKEILEKSSVSVSHLENRLELTFAKQESYLDRLIGDASVRGCCD